MEKIVGIVKKALIARPVRARAFCGQQPRSHIGYYSATRCGSVGAKSGAVCWRAQTRRETLRSAPTRQSQSLSVRPSEPPSNLDRVAMCPDCRATLGKSLIVLSVRHH